MITKLRVIRSSIGYWLFYLPSIFLLSAIASFLIGWPKHRLLCFVSTVAIGFLLNGLWSLRNIDGVGEQ